MTAGGQVAAAAVHDLRRLPGGCRGVRAVAPLEEHRGNAAVLHRHLPAGAAQAVHVHDLRVHEHRVGRHAALGHVDQLPHDAHGVAGCAGVCLVRRSGACLVRHAGVCLAGCAGVHLAGRAGACGAGCTGAHLAGCAGACGAGRADAHPAGHTGAHLAGHAVTRLSCVEIVRCLRCTETICCLHTLPFPNLLAPYLTRWMPQMREGEVSAWCRGCAKTRHPPDAAGVRRRDSRWMPRACKGKAPGAPSAMGFRARAFDHWAASGFGFWPLGHPGLHPGFGFWPSEHPRSHPGFVFRPSERFGCELCPPGRFQVRILAIGDSRVRVSSVELLPGSDFGHWHIPGSDFGH